MALSGSATSSVKALRLSLITASLLSTVGRGAPTWCSLRSPCPSMVVARCFRRDAPVLQRRFQDPAAVELAHRGAVELLPGGPALRDVRDAVLPLAAFDLLVWHQHVAAPGVQVYADRVTGPEPGQAAAGGALGRGVEDRGAVGEIGRASC